MSTVPDSDCKTGDLNVLDIAKQSLQILWRHKSLWFFGFFLVGAAGGGANPRSVSHAAHGTATFPQWLVPVLVAAALVAIGSLVLHVLSEAALIDEVRRANTGKPLGIAKALREAKAYFGRILALKLLLTAGYGLVATLIAAPALLAAAKLIAAPVGIGLSVFLALPGVPALLTIFFAYEYALRIAVLEDVPALEAVRRARIFLHGRLSLSIELLVAWYLGVFLCLVGAVVALVPAALVAGVCFLAAGKIAAIVGAAALMVPVLAAATGAMGTYRSSVWTLGYLKARQIA